MRSSIVMLQEGIRNAHRTPESEIFESDASDSDGLLLPTRSLDFLDGASNGDVACKGHRGRRQGEDKPTAS